MRQRKSEYYQKQFQTHQHDPKALWKTINTLSGRVWLHTKPKASLSDLENTFASIVADTSRPKQLPLPSGPQPLSSFGEFRPVTSDTVLKLLQDLNPQKATGSDGIPSIILKKCAPALSTPLCHIINESLASRVVPDVYKLAHVCPLFKGGDPKNPTTYRPIHFCRLFPNFWKKLSIHS